MFTKTSENKKHANERDNQFNAIILHTIFVFATSVLWT